MMVDGTDINQFTTYLTKPEDMRDDCGKNERQEQTGTKAPATRGRKDVVTKVLEARHVRDGRSLLEYAAANGKDEHFMVLVRCLRCKVRMDNKGVS